MSRKLIGAAVAALLMVPVVAWSDDTATSAAPAAAAATSESGTVVFFREKKFAGSAIRYKVRENGVELCKLGSGSFCTVQVPVGKSATMLGADMANMSPAHAR